MALAVGLGSGGGAGKGGEFVRIDGGGVVDGEGAWLGNCRDPTPQDGAGD